MTIYGDDTRIDIGEAPAAQQRAARSVGLLATPKQLRARHRLGERHGNNLHPSTMRFSEERCLGERSCFLIAPGVAITTAHNTPESAFQGMRVCFGYNSPADAASSELQWPPVESARIIDAGGERWSLLEVQAPDEALPLPLCPSSAALGDPLWMVGHPAGVSKKLSQGAQVHGRSAEGFVADLDAVVGNSGSPVFREGNSEVVGVLVSGAQDFVLMNREMVDARRRIAAERCIDASVIARALSLPSR